MASAISNDPYLSKGFEPIRMECDRAHLTIEGTVPADLDGTFYRVGPSPQFAPRGNYNPLNGDGMVHAFRVNAGNVSYRNRWVRTRQWTLEHAAGRALFGTSGIPVGFGFERRRHADGRCREYEHHLACEQTVGAGRRPWAD